MTVVVPFRLLSTTNLSIFQAIAAIALSNMPRAKGYNLEEIVKELSRNINRMTIRADP